MIKPIEELIGYEITDAFNELKDKMNEIIERVFIGDELNRNFI